MARIFILGAGASCFAGYPLGLDLWAFVRDETTRDVMSEQRASVVTDAIKRLLQVVPPREFDRPDLEQLFTLLDLAEAGMEPLELRKMDWRSLRPKLMGMIANAFQWYEYQLQARLREKDDPAAMVLDKWASRLHEGDTIVTFNWDLLHEAALWRREKWHYADGYGFTCSDAPSGCQRCSSFTVQSTGDSMMSKTVNRPSSTKRTSSMEHMMTTASISKVGDSGTKGGI
jgi:hypothetical protein